MGAFLVFDHDFLVEVGEQLGRLLLLLCSHNLWSLLEQSLDFILEGPLEAELELQPAHL